MRVCILGSPRSGTTSLLNYISESLNISKLNEPYNSDLPITEQSTWLKDNMAVKHLMHQLSNKQKLNLHKHFDKVVCIYRNDLEQSAESFLAGYRSNNWNRPYTYSSSEAIKKTSQNAHVKKWVIGYRKKEIKEFKELKYFTVTYEDLYYSDKDKVRLNEYLGITNPCYNILDLKNKLRTDPKGRYKGKTII
jgi:hypothetical protein